MKDALRSAIASLTPHLSQHSVQILNKPPTTELKFPNLKTTHDDGTLVSADELTEMLRLNENWCNVEIWGKGPRFVHPRHLPLPEYCLMVVSVVDDDKGTVGKSLMNTSVCFWGTWRTCLRWVNRATVPQCNQCQQWGHAGMFCRTNALICARCGGSHLVSQHEKHCKNCKEGKVCAPKCYNCFQPHFANDRNCPFFRARYNHDDIADLRAKRSRRIQELKQEQATEGKGKKNSRGLTILPPKRPHDQTPQPKQRTKSAAQTGCSLPPGLFAQSSAMTFVDIDVDDNNELSDGGNPRVHWEPDASPPPVILTSALAIPDNTAADV